MACKSQSVKIIGYRRNLFVGQAFCQFSHQPRRAVIMYVILEIIQLRDQIFSVLPRQSRKPTVAGSINIVTPCTGGNSPAFVTVLEEFSADLCRLDIFY